MLMAAAGAYVHVVLRLFQGGLLSLLGSLALMAWLGMTPHSPDTEKKRLAILSGFAFLTGTLMSGLSLLFLLSLFNMFYGSALLFKAHLYIGLALMCAFVLFDTQLIIEKAEMGDKDYIWHCVDLFLDFVTIFRKLMVILAMNEKVKHFRNIPLPNPFWFHFPGQSLFLLPYLQPSFLLNRSVSL
ncbi:UNVERIFIED_CONTAM: hypothetical protein FKN15_044174 [Acipenser sinensis]